MQARLLVPERSPGGLDRSAFIVQFPAFHRQRVAGGLKLPPYALRSAPPPVPVAHGSVVAGGAPLVLPLTLLVLGPDSRVALLLFGQLPAPRVQPPVEVVELRLTTDPLPRPRLTVVVYEADGKAVGGVVQEERAAHRLFPKASRLD